MLTEQTVERLRSLRLGAIADAYLTQQRDTSIAALSFDERLGMLVDAEQLTRDKSRAHAAAQGSETPPEPSVSRGSRLQWPP
jgi:hypothetical protein